MISKFFQPKQQQKKRSRNEISSSTRTPEDAADIVICPSEKNASLFPLASSIATGSSSNFAIEIIDIDDDDDESSTKKEEKLDRPTVRAAVSSSVDIVSAKDINPAIEPISGDQNHKEETKILSEIKIDSSTATMYKNSSTSDLESGDVAVTSPAVIASTEGKIDTEVKCLSDYGMELSQKDDNTVNGTTVTTNTTASTNNEVGIEKDNQPNHASFHQNEKSESATDIPMRKTPPTAIASVEDKIDMENKFLSDAMESLQKDDGTVNIITTETTNTPASPNTKVDIEKENQPHNASFHQNDKFESTTEIPNKKAIGEETNPFAQFAFQDESKPTAYSSVLSQSTLSTQHLPPVRIKTKKDIAKQTHSLDKKKKSLPSSSSSSKTTSAKSGNKKEKTHQKWVRMVDLSVEEQNKITQKWHSLADPNAPLEVRRFQIVVAARLHARCQEAVVRKVMKSLREVFTAEENDKQASANHSTSSVAPSDDDHDSCNSNSGLCVSAVAKADPEVLANVISSIQYYNTKAKHIVMAANEIESRFGGLVPESEHSLKSLTGIGEVMGDLLAFVNNRQAHLAEKATR